MQRDRNKSISMGLKTGMSMLPSGIKFLLLRRHEMTATRRRKWAQGRTQHVLWRGLQGYKTTIRSLLQRRGIWRVGLHGCIERRREDQRYEAGDEGSAMEDMSRVFFGILAVGCMGKSWT
jgi:hypothetical protein